MPIDTRNLSRTVDALSAAQFDDHPLSARERGEAARWIAPRQGLDGAYADTFAGFPDERAKGIVVFTGERIASASARHILGEEASRALRQLRVRNREVTQALAAADAGLLQCLARAAADPRHTNPGLYCCGKCSVGLWRNLLSGGLDRQEERLHRGAAHLRTARDDAHGWRPFPFWYTVLALGEMDFAEARTELKHAAPELERVAGRRPASSESGRRRQTLAARTLERL